MTKSVLSVVLIGPDEERRRVLGVAFRQQQVAITGELGAYPNFNHLAKLTESDCDVVVVDLDRDPEVALDLVENICSRNSLITVMAYSSDRDPELLVKCMRAGAREFLSEPISSTVLAEAVIRASARRLELDRQKKVSGKILVFWGAKGGSGVTTLASNFAIALKRESSREVSLVDLNIQLGDLGVVLGLTPSFTIADALRNPERLDQDFVSTLLVEHSTGVSLLAAPDHCIPAPLVHNGNLGKLLYILRDQFPYVVVDAGPSLGGSREVVFEMADAIYLVTQAEISSLRNAQRLASHLQETAIGERRVEVVLNRYDPRNSEIDEARITKVLDLPLKWKVPNDYLNVRRSLDTGVPLALQNTPVARTVYQMAREACGKPALPVKKSKWGLF
ncbi:MAG: AAA family ATPase [Acidobacteria bacterium]|nr:AAA family ATPase [Acidobacteriota bacterium]